MKRLLFATAAAFLLCACQPDRPIAVTSTILSPAALGSAEPNLSAAADGTLVLSWLEPAGGGVALRYSVLGDAGWSEPSTVAQGDDWFVNWADFPSVVKISESTWAAHWLSKRPGGVFAYDVAISISNDGGRTWGAAITPHTDDSPTEHGFVSLFPWQDGVAALWLDGRNMVGADSHNHGSATAAGMTLRSAMITADGYLEFEQLADDFVCDCCQTDVTVGPDGPIAVYRDRSKAEIRDIYVIRSDGGTWLEGTPVADDNWKIAGCPVNGPAIASDGPAVAVAWFTAANNSPRVKMAWSGDAGVTFGRPVTISDDRPIGRVGVAILDDGDALVSWLRTADGGRGEIVVRRVGRNGEASPVYVVASTDAGRVSGFPQLQRYGNGVVLAWTDVSGDETRLRTAMLIPTRP